MTYNVFKELKDNMGEFISGERISKKFNISRAAINKHIVKLKNLGYQILSNTKSGYKYFLDEDILSEYGIKYALNHYGIDDVQVFYYDEINSTNTVSKTLDLDNKTTLIVANKQTSGRGRRERKFSSNEDGIYMTLVYFPKKVKINEGLKSVLLAGESVCDMLEDYGIHSKLKYPNDCVVDGKKISGILCEMSSDAEYIEKIIIGIGLNVNNEMFEPELKDIAISMKMLNGKTCMRDRIIGKLTSILIKRLKEAEKDDFKKVVEDYENYSNTIGREIKVIEDENNFYYGVAKGIDSNGFLIVETSEGEKRVVSADVSIRSK